MTGSQTLSTRNFQPKALRDRAELFQREMPMAPARKMMEAEKNIAAPWKKRSPAFPGWERAKPPAPSRGGAGGFANVVVCGVVSIFPAGSGGAPAPRLFT